MKIHLPALALLSNLFFAAAALAAPELTVEKGKFNFGTITQGKQAQHTFKIKNSGDAPLEIRDVSVDCGCTAAQPSASVIAPGGSAEIAVTFDSTNFSGKVEKNVTVTTNAANRPSYTFNMVANVAEELQVSPRQLNLGPIAKSGAKKATVKVTNRGDSKVRILSVKASSNTLQIKAAIKKKELKPGETGTIELSVTPRPGAKVLSGYLHIQTSHPQKKEITVAVYASAAK